MACDRNARCASCLSSDDTFMLLLHTSVVSLPLRGPRYSGFRLNRTRSRGFEFCSRWDALFFCYGSVEAERTSPHWRLGRGLSCDPKLDS